MGGAERQGLLLAHHLKEREGTLVKVWGLGQKAGPVSDWCERFQIPWRAVPLHWGVRRRLAHLLRFAFLLRQERPEIVLSYTRVPNLAASLVWRFCGVRLCVWNQADTGLLLGPTFVHRYAVKQTGHFIANAEGGRRYLLETFGLQPDAVHLIRNGIALAPPQFDRRDWRKKLQVDADTSVVVMVANLSSYKDHATLLVAWKKLLDQWSGALPILVLAGRFDDRAACLQNQALQLGIARQVRFPGVVDDVSGLLGASDLCVHSSPSEGIPNAVIEAMAAGLAVTGSDIPGMREAVGDDGIAFLAPPADADSLSALMIRLLSDNGLRFRQSGLMRDRATALFGLERMCCETASYLKSCLGEKR
jgi:glycosyltransferase involved in cell wall biosynthesis